MASFRARESFVDRRGAGRLRLVPFAIVFRHRVDVVRGLVVVLHFKGLPGHQRDDVRVVHAALLIERDGIVGRVENVLAHVVLHEDDDVPRVPLSSATTVGGTTGDE